MLIDKREEIKVGDQLLIIDLSLGEGQELRAEVIEIRRILGRPTYLVETGSGDRKLVGAHQIRSDGFEQVVSPNTLLVFEPGEQHAVRALDNLVFVGFLHGAPGAQK